MQPQDFIDLLQSSLLLQYFVIAYLSSITTMILMFSAGRKELAEVNYRSRGKYKYTHQIIDVIIAGLLWPATVLIVAYYYTTKTFKQ